MEVETTDDFYVVFQGKAIGTTSSSSSGGGGGEYGCQNKTVEVETAHRAVIVSSIVFMLMVVFSLQRILRFQCRKLNCPSGIAI